MRNQRPSDVIDAVRYVMGADPCDKARTNEVIAARRLAIAAMREICPAGDCRPMSYKACAHALGFDHTTIIHHARGAVSIRLLKAVADRVNETLEAEEAEQRVRGLKLDPFA